MILVKLYFKQTNICVNHGTFKMEQKYYQSLSNEQHSYFSSEELELCPLNPPKSYTLDRLICLDLTNAVHVVTNVSLSPPRLFVPIFGTDLINSSLSCTLG